jgi:hypothetical protein
MEKFQFICYYYMIEISILKYSWSLFSIFVYVHTNVNRKMQIWIFKRSPLDFQWDLQCRCNAFNEICNSKKKSQRKVENFRVGMVNRAILKFRMV